MPAIVAAILSGVVQALRMFLPALVPWLIQMFFKLAVGVGVSFVSYKLIAVSAQKILDKFAESYFMLPHDLLSILALAGFPEALNIIFGGFSFCFGLWASFRSLRFLNKG